MDTPGAPARVGLRDQPLPVREPVADGAAPARLVPDERHALHSQRPAERARERRSGRGRVAGAGLGSRCGVGAAILRGRSGVDRVVDRVVGRCRTRRRRAGSAERVHARTAVRAVQLRFDRFGGRGVLQAEWTAVEVPANGTVILMHFGVQQTGRAQALASVQKIGYCRVGSVM